MARGYVQNTHISEFRQMHGAIVDLVGILNRPDRDSRMIEEAGIHLDRALFSLLVLVGRYGPIGVVELADRVGRDHTTVSRQVSKMEALGLVERQPGARDKRVREAALSQAGWKMNQAIDAARDRRMSKMLADWSADDIETLAPLLRKLADSALASD
ncbi:unnamed protein product [Phaeothamnion confervicola]